MRHNDDGYSAIRGRVETEVVVKSTGVARKYCCLYNPVENYNYAAKEINQILGQATEVEDEPRLRYANVLNYWSRAWTIFCGLFLCIAIMFFLVAIATEPFGMYSWKPNFIYGVYIYGPIGIIGCIFTLYYGLMTLIMTWNRLTNNWQRSLFVIKNREDRTSSVEFFEITRTINADLGFIDIQDQRTLLARLQASGRKSFQVLYYTYKWEATYLYSPCWATLIMTIFCAGTVSWNSIFNLLSLAPA